MTTSLDSGSVDSILAVLGTANNKFDAVYSGEPESQQPVHTVYGGAQLFKSDSAIKLGKLAVKNLETYAPDAESFADALGLPNSDSLRKLVYSRVKEKVVREAIEDFRIDFEDGFGNRPDAEEDETAINAARATAKGMKDGTLPPFIGIRIKPFTEELKSRGVRTLDIFVSTLIGETEGKLPNNFVVTLPKVTIPEQVTACVKVLEQLEVKLGLASGTLKMEIMIETTQSIIGLNGYSSLPSLADAGGDRITGAHFGTYDYTASCSIVAAYQEMDHPSCDFARHMMKVSYGGRPIWLSDGATNVMPVGPNRAAKGSELTKAEFDENRRVVHRAWKLAYGHIRHSLKHGYYQGWDLHPAQFPIRYAACYSFFLEGLEPATARLSAFMEKAAQATLLGDVFDDAATGQGLLNYFLRALNCGAITSEEVCATGLTLDEIKSRSFALIMKNRREKSLEK
jgi:hypothetical protein